MILFPKVNMYLIKIIFRIKLKKLFYYNFYNKNKKNEKY
jgi:hypothetical protein